MQIVCATTTAAAEVLSVLLHAGLHPFYDYRLGPNLPTSPPIVFTLLLDLTPMQLDTILAVSDIRVETEVAA
jgi:hypothetical protein